MKNIQRQTCNSDNAFIKKGSNSFHLFINQFRQFQTLSQDTNIHFTILVQLLLKHILFPFHLSNPIPPIKFSQSLIIHQTSVKKTFINNTAHIIQICKQIWVKPLFNPVILDTHTMWQICQLCIKKQITIEDCDIRIPQQHYFISRHYSERITLFPFQKLLQIKHTIESTGVDKKKVAILTNIVSLV